ncbi:MAG: hypothetical protein IPG53_01950 [Ignavibacteriales bacterium]|nr:hypothetical protein [Ignavibacteriales bacterium]
MKNYRRTIIYSIIASVVLYLAFSIYADIDKVIDALSKFSLLLIPAIFGLVFANYIFRFFKWHYYLGLIDVKIGAWESFLIFEWIHVERYPRKDGRGAKIFSFEGENWSLGK